MKRAALLSLLPLLAGCGSGIVPADFEPPARLEHPDFVIRPIRAADAEKDYEAVMESIDIIRAALLGDGWPAETFTLEQNRADLAKKERLFARRRSFTYTVVAPDESRVLGSVYINKGMRGPDAAVFLWVRRSAHEEGLDPVLERAVRGWIDAEWPFEWVVYPGRGSGIRTEFH
ncbi:MAG: GNAT family N-acetyltransferase [Candidatus Eisenbacteria bacterium]